MADKRLSKEEVEKIKKRVAHTMECEKMPVSKQDQQNGEDILTGKKSVEQVIAEETAKMKEEGLIK